MMRMNAFGNLFIESSVGQPLQRYVGVHIVSFTRYAMCHVRRKCTERVHKVAHVCVLCKKVHNGGTD